MAIRTLTLFTALILAQNSAYAENQTNPRDLYNWMKDLKGDWVLAPADEQEGKATKHKLVAPLVGTNTVAMSFRTIGKGSTVQENLLPGTKAVRKEIPAGRFGNAVRLGEAIFSNTANHPLSSPYVGNKMNCESCHLDAGRLADAPGPIKTPRLMSLMAMIGDTTRCWSRGS